MKHYELLTVLPGTLSETEVPERIKQVTTLLSENGATEVTVEDMGKSRMAYPMKHIRYGYYHKMQFQAEPEQLPTLHNKLRLQSEMLRAIITSYVPAIRQHAIERRAAFLARSEGVAREEQAKEAAAVSHHQEPAPIREKATVTETHMTIEDIDKKLNELLEGDIKEI